jgi:HAD superfamily hydrolase (TIGR01549 family)
LATGLLFDFDGTLYGDWRLWISIIEETLSDFQITTNPHDALEMARRMIENGGVANTTIRISSIAAALARDRGINLPEEEVRTRFFERLDAHMDQTGPDEKTVRLLREFTQRGFRMGIVTFVRKPRIHRRLDIWKLREYFASVITPDDVAEFKPSPRPFLKAMEELHVRPDECFVVGDEPVDMIGGRKAGAKTIGLPQGFFTGQELERAGADRILGSLELLPTMVYK